MIAISEKYEIIQWIEKLNDSSIFDEIKQLKNKAVESNTDWWDEISEIEKISINKGLADIDNNKIYLHDDVKKSYEKWL